MTGVKYVNCYVDCHGLVVLNFFIKYFFIFCVSVHTAKEPEVTNEGFGMLEGNWKQQRIWGESWDSCFVNVLLSLIYGYVLIYVNVHIAVC